LFFSKSAMKFTYIAILFGLFVTFAMSVEEFVIELNYDNFEKTIASHPLILVEFYAPWCGHCKHLAPEYEEAANQLQADKLPLAKIDADNEDNKMIGGAYGIQSFPTIKLFRDGKPTDYQGERTSAAIVAFMRRQAQPTITRLTTVEEIEAFSEKEKIVIVGFFKSEDSEEYSSFHKVAELRRNDFPFGASIGNSAADSEFGVSPPAVIVFKKFDEGKNVLTSDKFSELESFVSTHSLPLIDEIGPQNFQYYSQAGLPMGYLFVDLTVSGQLEEYLPKLRPSAEKTKGKINWIYIDWAKYSRHSERLGLSGKVVPALSIDEIANGKHFAFDETKVPTVELIQAWVDDYLAGKLEETIRSEEIPQDNSGPVKVVVAKSFQQIVLDPSKDVLLEFYAPWCGHCKSLAPIYEEVGKEFETIPGVVIAKIDATVNDVDPKLGIRGFPTVKFFPAGEENKSNPMDYDGDRSKESILAFVKEHSKNTLSETQKSDKDEL